jgi:GNAT superfamily N-acetyltransferase
LYNIANRFEREGEILLGVFRGAGLIGVGGLNRDPYLGDPAVGRLRHIYVLGAERREGVGRRIVERLLEHARQRFARVRLSTGRAASFYEKLGFEPTDEANATHGMTFDRR